MKISRTKLQQKEGIGGEKSSGCAEGHGGSNSNSNSSTRWGY